MHWKSPNTSLQPTAKLPGDKGDSKFQRNVFRSIYSAAVHLLSPTCLWRCWRDTGRLCMSPELRLHSSPVCSVRSDPLPCCIDSSGKKKRYNVLMTATRLNTGYLKEKNNTCPVWFYQTCRNANISAETKNVPTNHPESVLTLIGSVSLCSGVDPCLLCTHRPILESLA